MNNNSASGTGEGKAAEDSSNVVAVDRIVQQLGVLSVEQLANLRYVIQGLSPHKEREDNRRVSQV